MTAAAPGMAMPLNPGGLGGMAEFRADAWPGISC